MVKLKTIWQKWSPGDPLQKKQKWSIIKHDYQGASLIVTNSSTLKSPIRIQNSLAEIATGCPSSKLANTNVMRRKTCPPWGVSSFLHVHTG